jgi:hypothetical protein
MNANLLRRSYIHAHSIRHTEYKRFLLLEIVEHRGK